MTTIRTVKMISAREIGRDKKKRIAVADAQAFTQPIRQHAGQYFQLARFDIIPDAGGGKSYHVGITIDDQHIP